jgi:hypothetical protein
MNWRQIKKDRTAQLRGTGLGTGDTGDLKFFYWKTECLSR